MIRKATIKDIAAVAYIYNAVLDLEEAHKLNTGWKKGVYPTKITAEKALENDELYVMEKDGQIVASARINQLQEKEYQKVNWCIKALESEVLVLHTLVVNPEHSGKGYGRKFISFYEDMGKKMQCKCLRMDTQKQNATARDLYKYLGYIEIGIVSCEFNGIDGVELVCLEKLL